MNWDAAFQYCPRIFHDILGTKKLEDPIKYFYIDFVYMINHA